MSGKKLNDSMHDKTILRVVSKLLIPFIFLFALYVQWHGDFGPGGGFQAGVIFGAGYILYGLIFGLGTLREALPAWVTRTFLCLGVLIYSGVGVACMLLGGQFLDYGVLSHDPLHGQHLGILLVEIGVGITVFSAMVTIFCAFAGRAAVDANPLTEQGGSTGHD